MRSGGFEHLTPHPFFVAQQHPFRDTRIPIFRLIIESCPFGSTCELPQRLHIAPRTFADYRRESCGLRLRRFSFSARCSITSKAWIGSELNPTPSASALAAILERGLFRSSLRRKYPITNYDAETFCSASTLFRTVGRFIMRSCHAV